jgi:SAM-dependent methyltransferase
MTESEDIARLRIEYKAREGRSNDKDIYSLCYKPYLFSIQNRMRNLLNFFKKNGIHSLRDLKILEVGCGSGGVLLEYLSLDAFQKHLFGIDLLQDRLKDAHLKLPAAGISCTNGQFLPFPNNSFDLVLQYTAFSSVLDPAIKEQMACEMKRVLKPGGMIVWYDFWLNPTNPQTRGIRPREIRVLFPNCHMKFQKITLAPPVARLIVPFSWNFALFLERLKIFNTRYMVIIRKPKK